MVEGDEYDSAFFDKRPKFLHYLPDVAVIGNVEFDHADIYPDLAAVQTAFRRLMGLVPRRGLLVAGVESPALREILPGAPCPVETFAVEAAADWRAIERAHAARRATRFRLARRGAELGEFALALAGEHNVRNALAALAVAARMGVSPEVAARGPPRVPRREAPAGGAGHGPGGHRLRRLRPPSDGGARDPEGRPRR